MYKSIPVMSSHPILSGSSFSGKTKVSLYGLIGNGPVPHPQPQPSDGPTSLKLYQHKNSQRKLIQRGGHDINGLPTEQGLKRS